MPVNPVCLKLDDGSLSRGLAEALEALQAGGAELVLDFSAVRRIGPGDLATLAELAGRGAAIACAGVTPPVYKVLKLMKLEARFSFAG